MLKKYIEIKLEGRVVAICPIKECEVSHFIELEKEAKKNLAALIFDYNNQKEEIKKLEKEIKILKGEED